jgi:hypothetical protein
MRERIERALVDGVTYAKIVRRFSTAARPLNEVNLCRHRKHLLPKELIRQAPPPQPEVATTLLQRVETLVGESRAIAEAAKTGQQWIAATSALREVRCCIELLGKLTGEISPTSINFNNFNFNNLTDENLGMFLDAVAKRGDARIRALVREKLGMPSPIFQVNFVDSAAPGLVLEAPTNGNGHA